MCRWKNKARVETALRLLPMRVHYMKLSILLMTTTINPISQLSFKSTKSLNITPTKQGLFTDEVQRKTKLVKRKSCDVKHTNISGLFVMVNECLLIVTLKFYALESGLNYKV